MPKVTIMSTAVPPQLADQVARFGEDWFFGQVVPLARRMKAKKMRFPAEEYDYEGEREEGREAVIYMDGTLGAFGVAPRRKRRLVRTLPITTLFPPTLYTPSPSAVAKVRREREVRASIVARKRADAARAGQYMRETRGGAYVIAPYGSTAIIVGTTDMTPVNRIADYARSVAPGTSIQIKRVSAGA